jgi:hypothetical protein
LESDSPHLPDVAGSINHPAHLFRVAEEVTRVRDQSPLEVGSRVSIRPELNCGLIPIEAMEMNTLQGVGDFVLRQAQYLPVLRIRCLGVITRGPDVKHQRHIRPSKRQHPLQSTPLYSKGASLQSIPTSPKAVTAGESNSLDRRSK